MDSDSSQRPRREQFRTVIRNGFSHPGILTISSRPGVSDHAARPRDPPGQRTSPTGNPAVAELLWHHDNPRGPRGRFRCVIPTFWSIWDFSQNILAAKDLLRHVARKDVVDKMVLASQGFDIPVITSHYRSNDYWTNAEPPKGVLYNYPVRGDEKQIIAGYPAPPEFDHYTWYIYIIITKGSNNNAVVFIYFVVQSVFIIEVVFFVYFNH